MTVPFPFDTYNLHEYNYYSLCNLYLYLLKTGYYILKELFLDIIMVNITSELNPLHSDILYSSLS